MAAQFKVSGTVLFKASGTVAMDANCCCGECSPCCSEADTLAEYTVDFGAGGLTDGTATNCDLIAGEYVVPNSGGGDCSFSLSVAGGDPIAVVMRIVSSGGNCFWRVTVGIGSNPEVGGERAIYETTPESSSTFDCTDLPVTLDKVFELWVTECTGTLPATITIDV